MCMPRLPHGEQICTDRPPGGSTGTQQMCEQTHTQATRWQHWNTTDVHRDAQATHHMEILSPWTECQQKSLLPRRDARTQLAGEPDPLLCSPGTEHGCQMHCDTVELICETHVCVGLPRLSQDCDLADLWTKVPVPAHGYCWNTAGSGTSRLMPTRGGAGKWNVSQQVSLG